MTNSHIEPELTSKIEHLIELLTQMLSRDAHPLADRMDEFLQELTRIDRSMATAAAALTNMSPQLTGMASQADLEATEYRISTKLQRFLEQQIWIEKHLVDLFTPPGHEQDG